ncbi:MAG TPA: TetR/AcrR family transcriptional regulator [Solirubrobacterales bacterium]|nr:TetR/AcrR family transcriptional regulator [Solirubrobacterales bacterium]
MLSSDFVDHHKRVRIGAAVGRLVCERGLQNLSVGGITSAAKMARSTFYTLFENRDDAVIYAIGRGNQRLRSAIDFAVMAAGSREERVRRVVEAVVETAETEPHLVELSLVHACGITGTAVPFDPDLVQSLAGVLRPLRSGRKGRLPGPRTEELVAYSILGVIANRLSRRGPESLAPVARELADLTALYFTEEG